MRFFWGFPNSSIDKESTCQCRRPWFNSCIGMIPWRRDRLPTQVFLGFPCGSAVKESTYNAGDLGRSELGRSPGEGKGYPLKYSDLEIMATFNTSLQAEHYDSILIFIYCKYTMEYLCQGLQCGKQGRCLNHTYCPEADLHKFSKSSLVRYVDSV